MSIAKEAMLASYAIEALEVAPFSVVITDALRKGNPIVYVNPSFTKLTGYSREEIIGQSPRILSSGASNITSLDLINEAVQNQTAVNTVVSNLRKNGERFWNRLQINPIFNAAGHVVAYIGISQDISEQVHKERELIRMVDDHLDSISNIVHDRTSSFVSLVSIYNDLIQQILSKPCLSMEDTVRLREYSAKIQKAKDEFATSAYTGAASLHRNNTEGRDPIPYWISTVQDWCNICKLDFRIDNLIEDSLLISALKYSYVRTVADILIEVIIHAAECARNKEDAQIRVNFAIEKLTLLINIEDNCTPYAVWHDSSDIGMRIIKGKTLETEFELNAYENDTQGLILELQCLLSAKHVL